MHDFVGGLEIRRRPLVSRVGGVLDGGSVLDEVGGVQTRFGFVLRVESLQMAARRHIPRMLLEVGKMHLPEELVLLLAAVLIAHPDAVELVGEPHFVHEVLRRPVSGQHIEDGAVARQHEELDVVRSGAVRSDNGIAKIVVAS